ncbi:MAG: XTP/dITP diphosphatase [Lachnospiraceae bacterium]|nr:XTP/dITP diphosphatase [Lachnospiraceae bacterium]
MKIIIATGNAGKMKEIKSIFNNSDYEVVSMKEEGISADVDENGATFEENALIKAREIAKLSGHIVLADDSGLEVDALNKEPGIYSARYMGEDTPYSVKNASLIARLDGVEFEKRTARFVCAVAAVYPDGKELVVRETMEGYIGYEEKGKNGFGYDPIFYLKEFDKTSAEISLEEKNEISHRGKAFRAIKKLMEEM